MAVADGSGFAGSARSEFPEDFQVGRVVSRTFDVLLRNATVFLALAALVMIPVLLLSIFSAQNAMVGAAAVGRLVPGQLPRIFAWSSAAFVIDVVCTYTLQAALVLGTVSYLNGDSPQLGRCFSTGLKSFFSIFVIAILSLLGMMLGFVLLVVPGIILMLSWAVVIPARITEHTSIGESFRRSRGLTKGYRWKIFGLFFMYFLVAMIIGFASRPLFGIPVFTPSAGMLGLPYLVFNWLVRVVLSAVSAVGIASLYYELRLVKEGIVPSEIVAAFD